MEKNKPLSIMIVDDEMLVRTGIASFLNWDEYGYAISAQADNGLAALEIIRKKCPDIILLDIKMPEMDGVELLRILKREQLPVKVIVLSCHNELEYVKESIRLGAEDYILKLSLQPETLLTKLSEVRKKIEEEGSTITDSRMEFPYKNQDDLLHGLITGQIKAEEADCLSAKELRILSLRPARLPAAGSVIPPPTPLQQRSLDNLCRAATPKEWRINLTSLPDCCQVLLLRSEKRIGDDEVTDFFHQLKRTAQHYLSLVLSAGVSVPFTSTISIPEAYEQAVKICKSCFCFHTGAVMFFSPELTFLQTTPSLDTEQEELLRHHVMNGDASAAKSIINEFFSGMLKAGFYPPDRVRFAAIEIIHGLSKILPHTQEYEENILFSAETLEDLRTHIFNFIDTIIQSWKESRSDTRHPGLLKARQFILSNIDKPISLEKVAKAARMSRCYFSTMFAQETGESLTSYMNRMKIEHAKTLLLRDGKSNAEAAEQIGISDASYFGKLFKKYTGMSPARFRRTGETESGTKLSRLD